MVYKNISVALRLQSFFVACVYSWNRYSLRGFYLLNPQDSSQVKQVPCPQRSSCLGGGWGRVSSITADFGGSSLIVCVQAQSTCGSIADATTELGRHH